LKGICVTRPIVYGNLAVPMKVPKNDHTHKWTIFVRGINNEDLSYFIKKVQFRLHETYQNPLRTCENPPFEVSETGWGEFEVVIKIYFHPASNEKPVTVYHHLRLHPYEDDPAGGPWPKGKPVTSFVYEELAFNEPTEPFHRILTSSPPSHALPPRRLAREAAHPFSLELEREEMDKLEAAQIDCQRQIERFKDRLVQANKEIEALKRQDVEGPTREAEVEERGA